MMVETEREIWIPPLQASEEEMRTRLEYRHRILGLEVDGKLVGIAAWFYQRLPSLDNFPGAFTLFSTGQSNLEESNAAYIYNVGISSKFRKRGFGTALVKTVLDMIREDGVVEVYLDGRCSSYNGSMEYEQEQIEHQPIFKKRIDEAYDDGKVPSLEDIRIDPGLRFYNNVGFKPFRLIANFLPEDTSSGGFRVILHITALKPNQTRR